MFDKAELKENLSKCVAEVKFTKADGTLREMTCTLIPSYIMTEETKTHVPRKSSDEVLAVWDIEKNGWRSFRLDSITNINYIGTESV